MCHKAVKIISNNIPQLSSKERELRMTEMRVEYNKIELSLLFSFIRESWLLYPINGWNFSTLTPIMITLFSTINPIIVPILFWYNEFPFEFKGESRSVLSEHYHLAVNSRRYFICRFYCVLFLFYFLSPSKFTMLLI